MEVCVCVCLPNIIINQNWLIWPEKRPHNHKLLKCYDMDGKGWRWGWSPCEVPKKAGWDHKDLNVAEWTELFIKAKLQKCPASHSVSFSNKTCLSTNKKSQKKRKWSFESTICPGCETWGNKRNFVCHRLNYDVSDPEYELVGLKSAAFVALLHLIRHRGPQAFLSFILTTACYRRLADLQI